MKKITICRKWNNPQITITVTSEDISLEMSLEDYLVALADEVAEPLVQSIVDDVGNPTLWFTKEALSRNLIKALEGNKAHEHLVQATERVITKVKQETSKVV